MPLEDQEPTLRRLWDRSQIVELAANYALAVDSRDWDRFAALFTQDAQWEFAGSGVRVSGPDAVVAAVRGTIDRLDATQHLNANHVVDVVGDTATHTCYAQAQHVRRGLPEGEHFLAGVRYDDRMRRTPDGWRFTHRLLTNMWATGNPAVIGR